MNTQIQKFIYLDAIRGISAIAVVIYHITQHNSLHYFPSAHIAVDIFFALSGFVMAHNYSRISLTTMKFYRFYYKRILRVYPLFLVGLILGFAAIYMKILLGLTSINIYKLPIIFLSNSFFIPTISKDYTIIYLDIIRGEAFPLSPPHWSLFFEMILYGIFYIICRYTAKLEVFIAIVAGISLLAIGSQWGFNVGWGGSGRQVLAGLPRALYGFFGGVVAYRLYSKSQGKLWGRMNAWAGNNGKLLACALSIFLVACFWWALPHFEIFNAIFVLCTPFIVLVSAFVNIAEPKVLKLFKFLGFISFPIYCIHYPIMNIIDSLSRIFHYSGNMYMTFAISFIISCIFAVIIGKYIDIPVKGRIEKMLKL